MDDKERAAERCRFERPEKTDPLAEFYINGELPRGEAAFLDALRKGNSFVGDGTTPVRARFLRAVVSSRDETFGVSGSVKAERILVVGDHDADNKPVYGPDGRPANADLDLSGLTIDREISIIDSRIDGAVILRFARIRALRLDGSTIGKLEGLRVHVTTSLYLRSLKADAARNREAKRFTSRGHVDLSGAKIGGALSARGAHIASDKGSGVGNKKPSADPSDKYALDLSDADIESIILGPKDSPGADGEILDGKKIDECIIHGGISFQRARCLSFTDCVATYDELFRHNHKLVLRGFRYKSLGRLAPRRDVKFRKKWLLADERRDEEFDPQPYEQLAEVLQSQGDTDAAVKIQVTKHRKIHFAKRPTTRDFSPGSGKDRTHILSSKHKRWIHWCAVLPMRAITLPFLELIAYGYRPYRILWFIFGFMFAGGLYFNHAFETGRISPSNIFVARSQVWDECLTEARTERNKGAIPISFSTQSSLHLCKQAPPEAGNDEARALALYPDFNGYWYAADAFLPFVSLRQQEFWVAHEAGNDFPPMRTFTQFFMLLGWLMSSVGIGGALTYLNRR